MDKELDDGRGVIKNERQSGASPVRPFDPQAPDRRINTTLVNELERELYENEGTIGGDYQTDNANVPTEEDNALSQTQTYLSGISPAKSHKKIKKTRPPNRVSAQHQAER